MSEKSPLAMLKAGEAVTAVVIGMAPFRQVGPPLLSDERHLPDLIDYSGGPVCHLSKERWNCALCVRAKVAALL